MEASNFLCTSFFPQFPAASDNFNIEEFLNFPNDDVIITDATFEYVSINSCNSSSFSAPDLSLVDGISPAKAISSVTSDINFTGDLCVPCDDLPKLEWLSNIAEESYTSEDLQNMELISGMRARNDNASKTNVKGQNNSPLVTWPEIELISDVKARNDNASKTMWEMELISDVRDQNDDVQKMELMSKVKEQNHDASETVQNIDVKPRSNNALEIAQNMESILGVEAQIKYALKTVQKIEMISGKRAGGPPSDNKNNMIFNTEMFVPAKSRSKRARRPSSDIKNNMIFNTEVFVPAKSRSKRARGPPSDWTSRLLLLSPTTRSLELEPKLELEPEHGHEFLIPTLNPSFIGVSSKKSTKSACRRKENNDGGSGGDGRRCLHCATDKTPQWRTGPKGPKTLCNACGVRYKSGRLVPEYRPAASPTFVMAKHSNSHRKVLELRRQKEMVQVQHHQQHEFFPHHNQHEFFQHHHRPNVMFDMDISNGDDFLIYQHVDPDFGQLI